MTNKSVARLGDTSDHGGAIITATGNAMCNGIGIAIDGDLHDCPIPGHGITPIASNINDVTSNGKGIITTGAIAGCGAKIITGSPNVTSQ